MKRYLIAGIIIAMAAAAAQAYAGSAESSFGVTAIVTPSNVPTAQQTLSTRLFSTRRDAIKASATSNRHAKAVPLNQLMALQKHCRDRAAQLGMPVSQYARIGWFILPDGQVVKAFGCR